MKQSGLWTREEAISEIARILDAAELAPQYVSTSNGRFTITFQRLDDQSGGKLFSRPGPLEKDDIGEI